MSRIIDDHRSSSSSLPVQGSGNLSSGGSEIQAEDGCSNSSRERDSPSDCLSPGPPLPPPPSSSSFGRSSSNHTSHAPPQPLSISSFDLDRLTDEHLRAKRARVENIIRGMSHSPLVRPSCGDHSQDGGRESQSGRERRRGDGPASLLGSPGSRGGGVNAGEVYRENKRKQRLPQQQHSFTQMVCSRQEQRQEERRQLRLQLEDMQVGAPRRRRRTDAPDLRSSADTFFFLSRSETTSSTPGEVLPDIRL